MIHGRPGVTPTIPTMDVRDRVVVVTGAGNGIGSAIAWAVHGAGARGVVVADVDRDRATEVAAALDAKRPGTAIALAADVSTEAANATLVDAATETFGPIDVFFANAGIAVGTDLEATDEATWRLAFDVNVHAHRWAAKHLLPGWLARGEGYFVSTASAAGLLAQIGSAPYSVTKHAAVAFAEWLRIAYGRRGVRVSCLCPQSVQTDMTAGGTGSAGLDGVLTPEQVGEDVVRVMREESFLVLPHPEVAKYFQHKGQDYDRWLGGMQKLYAAHMQAQQQGG
jgi:NAD(P)-dependent dehydrogenase (short-subunit alcohol dehydrogenase family)